MAILYYADVRIKKTAIKVNQYKTIQLKSHTIEVDFDFIRADLLFLSTQQKLTKNLGQINQNSSDNSQWKQELAQDYLSFSKYEKLYDQIRVINLKGKEVIRVNFNSGQPEIVPDEKLQDKVNRYWFQATLKQQPGQIFVSPLDLNIEQGKIEQPLKPVIRFAIFIYDNNGQKQGIMILNYLAQNFIDTFQPDNVSRLETLLMLNNQGFWLKGLKPEDEWGFMYPDREDETFQADFPQEWQTINNTDFGQFQTENGLFTYTTIYPLTEIQTANFKSFSRSEFIQNNDYAWKILSYIPSDTLNSQYYNSQQEFVLFYIALLVLLGIGCWLLSLSQVNRQLADAKQEKTLADLTAIINNLTDGLLVTDKTGQITRYNPAYLKLLNLNATQLLSQNCKKICRSELAELVEQTKVNPSVIVSTELKLPHERVGQAVATAITQQINSKSTPEIIGSLLLIRDITNEKKIDLMKTDFIATVSHELRTPLTSVLGFASITQEKLEENLFPLLPNEDRKIKKTIRRVKNNLNIIITEAERLTTLINDVLDIAKMEAGKVEWNMQNVSIEEIINQALAATASLFETNNLTVIEEIEPELPQIIADRNRLIQVMINLLSNAVKFTENGSITCRAKMHNHQIKVSIIDTGGGIAQVDQDKVFDKFKQVGETLTDKPKGTGLGLPICKQIIEHHGGMIFLESTLGKGSNFSFTLPVSTDRQPTLNREMVHVDRTITQIEDPEIETRSPTQEKFVILIVDDDPHIREFLYQFLEDENYEVQQAKNGLDAINQAKEIKPDLIILDIMMPQINGFEVTSILKNNPETRDIPIIILSIVDDYDQGYKSGVDQYLTKPINKAGLLDTMNLLLSQRKSNKNVLVVDQNASALTTLSQVLQAQGYNVVETLNERECIEQLISTQPNMTIIDSVPSPQRELVKSLRFEKGLENIFFILMGDPDKKSNDTIDNEF
ncbi:MAG: response regulator [Microcoleaceae cyanobacterium]